jgi:hypothetical protein
MTRWGDTQGRQDQGQRRRFRCNPKARKSNPVDCSAVGAFPGVPGGVCGREIDDQPHDGDRLEFDPPDTEAVDLEHAFERLRWTREQPSRIGFEVCTVVGNQPREG